MDAFATCAKVRLKKYDVFISFRGSDVRDGFLSHLTNRLRQEDMDVYVDDKLERGDQISYALLEAIEKATIALVIFSKNYASSTWCLQALKKIMECKQNNNQIVIPIFYKVDPTHVRHQEGSYADAFAQHEGKLNDDLLHDWKFVLKETANLAGLHYPSNFHNESELIDTIMKDVSKNLEDKEPIKPKHLIGLEENLADIDSFIKVESQKVGTLGIWGKGGIGKTTLARAIFDKFSRHFSCSYFASNVREELKKIGLDCLLDKILCALLNDANLTMKGRPNSQRRLRRKRVLLVLDDVDSYMQLNDLIAKLKLSLGPNSKVIITSRDKRALIGGGVREVHEVKELNKEESLQLFCRHAFNQTNPLVGYEKLSMQAIQYAGGLPLALKVLGSYLKSKDINTWDSALKKCRKHTHDEIQRILRVSYDGLDLLEKRTFVDISFFFRGAKKEHIIRVLDGCKDSYSSCVIDDLVDKALITISKDNTIEIHDLLHEMAENIVSEEFLNNPESRSWLNNAEEIQDVLINNKGKDAIEGIILKIENLNFTAKSFQKMSNLRFLKIQADQMETKSLIRVGDHIIDNPFRVGLDSLPNNLRYICWEKYPFKSLPKGFCPEKLVEVHLQDSRIKKLWNGVQDLINLKIVNLKSAKKLKELPDFSKARNLEIMDLTECFKLRSIHPSILSLPRLVSLDLSYCFKLKKLHGDNHMKSLKNLNLFGCLFLQEFLLSSEEMTRLDLFFCDIRTLNLPIGRFNKLEELYLGWRINGFQINELSCLTSLKKFSIHDSSGGIDKSEFVILFDAWHSLEELHLTRCKLSEIPDNISNMSLLKILALRGSEVESLPNSIKHLSKLKQVNFGECKKLRTLPELPPSITHFYVDNCTSLEAINFTMMQAIFYNMASEAKYCYPGGTIPKNFKFSQTDGRFIAIELPSSSGHLLGIVCYCTFSPTDFRYIKSILRKFLFEDEEIIYKDELPFPDQTLIFTDHVFVWYESMERILKETQRSRYYEANTFKFACEFSISDDDGKLLYDGMDDESPIKTCGLCPIYASEFQEMDQQMEVIKLEITLDGKMVQRQPSPDSDGGSTSGF